MQPTRGIKPVWQAGEHDPVAGCCAAPGRRPHDGRRPRTVRGRACGAAAPALPEDRRLRAPAEWRARPVLRVSRRSIRAGTPRFVVGQPGVPCVVVATASGQLISVSGEWAALMHAEPRELVGQHFVDFVLPEARDAAQAMFEAVRQSREVRSEALVKRPDGDDAPDRVPGHPPRGRDRGLLPRAGLALPPHRAQRPDASLDPALAVGGPNRTQEDLMDKISPACGSTATPKRPPASTPRSSRTAGSTPSTARPARRRAARRTWS